MHEQLVHERPYPCTECKARFATEDELNYHGTSGICQQNRTCYVCGDLFPNPKKLKDHLVDDHRGEGNGSPSEAVAKELEFHLAKIEEDKRISEVKLQPNFFEDARLGNPMEEFL